MAFGGQSCRQVTDGSRLRSALTCPSPRELEEHLCAVSIQAVLGTILSALFPNTPLVPAVRAVSSQLPDRPIVRFALHMTLPALRGSLGPCPRARALGLTRHHSHRSYSQEDMSRVPEVIEARQKDAMLYKGNIKVTKGRFLVVPVGPTVRALRRRSVCCACDNRTGPGLNHSSRNHPVNLELKPLCYLYHFSAASPTSFCKVSDPSNPSTRSCR